ncbi:ABC transporter ATP-binding protein [Polyangium jinanense]|uniref:ABC transporter ATP-binding protein n=1 Tax=Polyangium jinanense TaxID=2829994 RepID=UPI002341C595|nr:ABC transporter ATP-binding protein [Polyangium jinanense]MDC3957719.1 ABC transporter ATP-binding protein [Polyangium jinanense]
MLVGHASLASVAVNALTGRVLVHFDKKTPLAEVEKILHEALHLAREAHALRKHDPASAPAETGTSSSPALPAGKATTARTQPLFRLFERSQHHRRLFTLTLATTILDRAFDAAPSLMISAGLDIVTRGPQSSIARLGFKSTASQLSVLGAASLGAWTLDSATGYAHARLSSRLANVVQHDLRKDVYRHIQTLDLAEFEGRQMAEWLSVLQEDINRLEEFLKEGIDPLITILVNIIIVGAAFVTTYPPLAAVQFLIFPAIYYVSAEFLGPIRKRLIASRRAQALLDNLMVGNLSGLATVLGFNAQEREASRVEQASLEFVASSDEATALSSAYVPAIRTVAGFGFLTTLVWGAGLVVRGRIAASAYNFLAYTSLRLLGTLGWIGLALNQYQRTMVSLERVLNVLDKRPTILSGPRPLPTERVVGDLVLDNVVFGYTPEHPVLRGINMHFAAGKTTAIVGSNGAGKSTVLKLLLRFYDANAGAVRLDGIDVRELDLADLRTSMALVSQQIFLFAGSIRDNIAYARPDATMAEIEWAAKMAEAHDFITAMPAKYDTDVGEGGSRLSGGQRQRIAIARALLSQRPILVFDEATSAMDNETEAALQRSLREATQGRTTVMVVHRLSTARNADYIYVLDAGVVCEQGRHEDLVAQNGLYASFWRIQTGEAALPAPPSDPSGSSSPAS